MSKQEQNMTERFFCHIKTRKKSFGWAIKGEKVIRRLARIGSEYK